MIDGVFEVRAPGVLTTVQDVGRPGFGHLGVPPSGACDPVGLAIANSLIDNDPLAAALEVTLGGLELAVRSTTVVGLAGADLGAEVVEDRRALRVGASHLVRAGSTLAFRGRVDATTHGCRAYLAVAGGIEVPVVLGSRSTCLVGRFGGLDGRPLRSGDVLASRDRPDVAIAGRVWPSSAEITGSEAVPAGRASGSPPASPSASTVSVRVVGGPHRRRLGDAVWRALSETIWTVDADSDRMGVRLSGSGATSVTGGLGIVSVPMTLGAIQMPPDGRPIVLLADHQTVGGYPVAAVVIRADRPIAGQLGVGDRVSLEPVSMPQARAAWREAQDRFAQARRRMRVGHADQEEWPSAVG